jgi:CubicO group peptidase (beta-lactamase class C family)
MTSMRAPFHRIFWAAAVAVVVATSAGVRTQRQTAVFPGAEWERIADPKSVGFCQDKLDLVTARVKELPTTGMVVVVGGRLLWDYGDTKVLSYLASVRKSILAMLYGNYVKSGKIRLDKTLKDLNIDDVGGLLPKEREATVLDLITARSGVYHAASNAASSAGGDTVGEAPARGSVGHGTYFLYNNWDFNALGTIFEQETGESIYDVLERDLAKPIGMQDFNRGSQRKSGNASASTHLAYHMYLSTRDMARVGLVMLRQGAWAGTPLIPQDWAKRIVAPVTHVPDMHPDDLRQGPFGYGMLWWIWDGPFNKDAYAGAYTGRGAVGQYITVLPALDMVIAHKTNQNRERREVTWKDYSDVLDKVVSAKCVR